MSNILLVEPDYRSRFPPLGLMRIATHHKSKGDQVTFARGRQPALRALMWHRIYVSSLFTWELPRTLETIQYYTESVARPEDIIVGGVGVTLLPQFIRERSRCTIVEGPLDKPGKVDGKMPAIADLVPDYSILSSVDHPYQPADAYFTRITKGCIRKCEFCAVPKLETEFGMVSPLRRQIGAVDRKFGARQHLIVLDNNILGIEDIHGILSEIADLGFERGARRQERERCVDFNQGLDARLIRDDPRLAESLGKIALSPVRLAFDFIGMRKSYEAAVRLLADQGFGEFTNYMLFNFMDSPKELFDRLWVNGALNTELKIRITGFPMRFIPMDDVSRRHVAPKWKWRYLRGIQCVLLATRGLVSPNPEFLGAAFGNSYEEFLEILSMPDRYIIYREHHHRNGAETWRRQYRRMGPKTREELLATLEELNRRHRERKELIPKLRGSIRRIVEHYYPGGETPSNEPPAEILAQQGVSVGYDSGPG